MMVAALLLAALLAGGTARAEGLPVTATSGPESAAPADPSATPDAAAAQDAAAATPQLPTMFWVATGTAAGSFVLGVTLGFLALSAQSDFDAHPNDGDADRGEALAIFADAAFGLAIVSAITAVVLYGAHEHDEAPPKPATAKVAVTPLIAPGAGGAALRISF